MASRVRAADWQQVAARPPGTLRVLAVDRPGYGANRQPPAASRSMARARCVAELDARGIDRAVLVGHSYGGGVALAVAQLAPTGSRRWCCWPASAPAA